VDSRSEEKKYSHQQQIHFVGYSRMAIFQLI